MDLDQLLTLICHLLLNRFQQN
jgi:sodium/potassium/calcium exchanger 6